MLFRSQLGAGDRVKIYILIHADQQRPATNIRAAKGGNVHGHCVVEHAQFNQVAIERRADNQIAENSNAVQRQLGSATNLLVVNDVGFEFE